MEETPSPITKPRKAGKRGFASTPSSPSSSRQRSPSPVPQRASNPDLSSSFPDRSPDSSRHYPSETHGEFEKRAVSPLSLDRSPSPSRGSPRSEPSPLPRRVRGSHTTGLNSASPSPSKHRKRRTSSGVRSAAPSDDGNSSSDEAVLPQSMETDQSASILLSTPQEIQLRILEWLAPRDLAHIAGSCRYLASVSEVTWMIFAKKRYPQYTKKDWKVLQRRFTHSIALLNVALLRGTPDGSTATPPSQVWQFLYYHAPVVQYRNWLAGKAPTWSIAYTPLKPVRDASQGMHTALHQYHLFPTCMAADENLLVTGSGCYESVGDPTTLMIGARLVQFFDPKTGASTRMIPAHPLTILDIQLDSQYVYTCSIDRSIAIWDRNTGARVSQLFGHQKAIYQIQRYENLLLSAGKDKTIRFWDPQIRDETEEILFGHAAAPVEAEPIPLTMGVDLNGVPLRPPPGVNLRTGSRALRSVILAHEHSVRRFVACDGSLVSVSGSGQGCHWDIETRTLVRTLKILDDAIAAAAMDSDNFVIASNECVQHFDLRTPCTAPVRENKGSGCRTLTVDPAKMILADTKGFVRIWDWNLFREVNSLRAAKHRCCFYYDSNLERLYTGGSDKFVKMYDFSVRPASLEPLPPERKCSLM